MRIGDLANECGIPTQTIRFYERRRLLPPPAREANGYRVYDQPVAERIRFIQRAQTAGLTLAEIGGILDVRANGQPPCTHVSQLLQTKLHDVDQRIAELTELRVDLAALVDRSPPSTRSTAHLAKSAKSSNPPAVHLDEPAA